MLKKTPPVPALFTVIPPAPEMIAVDANAILPAPAAFRVNVPVAATPAVVTVSKLAVVLTSVPPAAVTVKPRVYEAAAPV